MFMKWMQLRALLEAEGVDGGGSGDGAAAAGADAGGNAAGAGGAAGDAPKVAVDGTVPGAGESGSGEGAPPSGQADPAAEGGAEKKAGEGEVKDGEKKDDEAFAFKPEDYAFKLPDGAEADPAQAEQFTAFALENKVPPELAQKLVDFHADVMQRQVKAWTDQVTAWGEETKNDPEYGGANYDQNMAVANRALAEFGGPKLGEAARQFGWGNHPEFVRFMVNVGKALGTATTERGGNSNVGNQLSRAEILYGDAK